MEHHKVIISLSVHLRQGNGDVHSCLTIHAYVDMLGIEPMLINMLGIEVCMPNV